MARKKEKITLQDALRGEFEKSEKELKAELDSDLKGLFDTLNSHKLVDAVIVRVQRYAAGRWNRSTDSDFEDVSEYEIDRIQEIIQKELAQWISSFISDKSSGVCGGVSCAGYIYDRRDFGVTDGGRVNQSISTAGRTGCEETS